MEVNLDPSKPRPRPRRSYPHSFMNDEDAKSTVAFAIGGTTVTVGGLLAWFAFGSLMLSLADGTLAVIGFFTILGVVAVLCMMAYEKWGP